MKRALIFLAVIGLASSLGAQSLVELAKREKERRESFRGRHAVVVTNRDLFRVKRGAAVEVTNPDAVTDDDLRTADRSASAEEALDEARLAAPPSGYGAASRLTPREGTADDDLIEGGGPLEDQLKAVDDLVDRLTTEMNALLQQYAAQNAMVPGSVIQEKMEETHYRLVLAQTRQSKLRAKMERTGLPIKRDAGPVGR